MSEIAVGAARNPYQIDWISFDKVLALPGKKGALDSNDPSQTIKVTIKVVWADGPKRGQPANADVNVSANHLSADFVALFNDDHVLQQPDSNNIYTFPGRSNGIIEIYVCAPQMMLFLMMAAVAAADGYDASMWFQAGLLTFYNYITFDVQSSNYPPIAINNVQIPDFPRLKFGITARVLSYDNIDFNIFTNCVVIINDNLIFLSGGPDILQSGFVIPYIFMRNSFDENNSNKIIYILSDTEGSTTAGGALTFTANGYPLAMPFPNKGASPPAVQLATSGNFVLDTLYLRHYGGIPLRIPIRKEVTKDDKYYLYIYVNGFVHGQGKQYKPYRVERLKVDVPEGYAGSYFDFKIPKDFVIGFAAADGGPDGYMWADCVGPDNETWSDPWGPQQIDFWPEE
ncbi:hypothetical protein GCM10011491_46690 [Brucella endophytica]|uniref:Uncharacterized protein n=1 Tax=Brucella endophytica TaxID=1963359 RepID=A0A916SU36_9HYPH|nr:hypothetical protein [Brucella endophytica]GGB13681.1 hypothetical protein GCM10011491_46690 [Brucella endophytica]